MGNAFNVTLYRLVGKAIGIEGKAISNVRQQHKTDIGDGLTYWSPTINMQRDPRWGRNQEVPGEDPYLTSQYAIAFVNGLQSMDDDTTDDDHDINIDQDGRTFLGKSSDGRYSKVRIGAACKHFVGNSLENWERWSRHNFDAHIDDIDLHNYYFPPFAACAKHAVGVMCSYNAVNGQPACANPWLLRDILRTQMNFSGYLVTDCGALADIVTGHHYAVDATQASAMAKNATVDVNCGDGEYFPNGLRRAYDEGWVESSTIRDSFTRMATVQFRLGLFDATSKINNNSNNPEDDIKLIGSSQHSQLAYEAAQQSIVLLQNRNKLLPLDPMKKFNLAIIGPHINATVALLSNYHGDKCKCTNNDDASIDCTHRPDSEDRMSCIETPLQAISKRLQPQDTYQSVKGLMGCTIGGTELNELDDATELAIQSDVVLLLLGLDQSQESEGLDRYETTLPGLQPKLLQNILEVAGDKTVIVLFHGGAMSLGQDSLDMAGAILTAGYGGQAGSSALADVLFGTYNPTGKLAATWYPPSFVNELPMTEMGLRVGVGRTHLFYQGIPEFPFGHGLSYNQWRLSWHSTSKDEKDDVVVDSNINHIMVLRSNDSIKIRIVVENLGPYFDGGVQTILLFWSPVKMSTSFSNSETTRINQGMVLRRLIGFQGTSSSVLVNSKEIVEFDVQWKDFALWNTSTNSTMVIPGRYELRVQGPTDCYPTSRTSSTPGAHHHRIEEGQTASSSSLCDGRSISNVSRLLDVLSDDYEHFTQQQRATTT
jgi:beta-D-xylosidase 4